ncbi:histidine phosphatase family protein [Candidatus Uhrbacteria bacterium]|nr:histidine phosphatase family protein [Candidatus Uhrbacteria bacterium]
MKTLFLVRHGQVDNPHHIFYTPEYPLSDAGKKEIAELADCLAKAGCHPKRLVSSPYLRTKQSAEMIAITLGKLAPEYDDRLVEWKAGAWIGLPLEQFREAAGYHSKPFHLRLADVEPYADAAARIHASADDILKDMTDGECSVIVSHREPMVSAILAWQGKTDWTEIPELDFPPGACWKLDFDQASGVLQNAARFDTLCRQQKTGV